MSSTIPENWYETHHVSDDISLITETYVANWLRCNIWHVRGQTHDLIIDTGMGMRSLKKEVSRLNEKPVICISTHCHFDHIGGAHEFECRLGHQSEQEIHANPTLANTAMTGFIRAETFEALPYEGFSHEDYKVQPAPLTGFLDEGDVLDLGNRHFNLLHLPGHSPGSIALFEEKTGILFSGDTIYDGDLYDSVYHSDKIQYRESLRRLREMPVNTIHGGHEKSFDKNRMIKIIDDYLEGKGVISDPLAWVDAAVLQ
jgi:glyoxylase-like metal-dependent hydrolase (beta-lactamase superfamily II)